MISTKISLRALSREKRRIYFARHPVYLLCSFLTFIGSISSCSCSSSLTSVSSFVVRRQRFQCSLRISPGFKRFYLRQSNDENREERDETYTAFTDRSDSIGRRKDSLKFFDYSEVSPVALVFSLGTGTFLICAALQGLLHQYEWFQTYRYLWYLVGGLYAWDGIVSPPDTTEHDGAAALPTLYGWDGPEWARRLARTLAVLAGGGLVVGGACDAFLPVYVTGPNLFTSAGLAPDSAAFLLLYTAAAFFLDAKKGSEELLEAGDRESPTAELFLRDIRSKKVFPTALLLSQLYILSEGTFDEIFSRF